MKMSKSCLFCILIIFGAGYTQDVPPEQGQPGWLLNLVFPNPTGDNGFEDFLIAAEILHSNIEWRRFQDLVRSDQATLRDKRAAVRSAEAALKRLRVGLARTRFVPRDEIRWETLQPELPHYRQLARLLAAEQEVLFAEGRELRAIDSFRDGYRLGQLLDQKTMLLSLVGKACTVLALTPLARRLEQLDYEECRHLQKVCSKLLEHRGDLKGVVEGELGIAEAFLRDAPADELIDLLIPYEDDDETAKAEIRALHEMLETMRDKPEEVEREARRAAEMLRQYYRELLAELGKPTWEQSVRDFESGPDNSVAGLLLRELVPPWSAYLERRVRDRAMLQLIAVHAAILEYRWWHDRVPDNLSVLKLGDIATDPFTGKPLIYKRLDSYRYKVYSAGPNKQDDDGKPEADVTLTR